MQEDASAALREANFLNLLGHSPASLGNFERKGADVIVAGQERVAGETHQQ